MYTNVLDQEQKLGAIVLSGDLDGDSIPLLSEQVDELMGQGIQHIILDLSEIHFMSSLGLGTIVECSKALKERSGSLKLICQRPRLLNEFKHTHLDDIIPIYANLDDARGTQPNL